MVTKAQEHVVGSIKWLPKKMLLSLSDGYHLSKPKNMQSGKRDMCLHARRSYETGIHVCIRKTTHPNVCDPVSQIAELEGQMLLRRASVAVHVSKGLQQLEPLLCRRYVSVCVAVCVHACARVCVYLGCMCFCGSVCDIGNGRV